MIYPFSQMMDDKERGRLFSIQMDGSDSVPFIIKRDKLLIGRGDSCEIRIYVEGVSPEHCIITFNDEGRGFVEPINKCGLTFLNGELIERQVSLEHNDVITIVKRSFRFFYPSSSKFYVALQPVANSEEKTDEEHLDFDPEEVFRKRGKEIQEKRVTFGPRLSPEEFDKNMPPASPLRRGSLPADKLKAKTPDTQKSHFKRALFNNRFSSSCSGAEAERFTAEKVLPRSTVVLHKLRCSNLGEIQKPLHEPEKNSTKSRPLFSEVLKKSAVNPQKDVAKQTLQRYSPKRLAKKAIKLQNSKKTFYKSPRRPIHPRVLAVGSTGHANSPETIVIYKKRNPVSSVKKRKSLRLVRGSLRSRKSISKKNNENPDNSALSEPISIEDRDLVHESPNIVVNPVAIPEINDTSLKEAYDKSTHKRKSVRPYNKNDSTPVQEQDTNEKQSSASPLAVAIDSVAHLDENNIDKSLKDIHNAVQALACHSNVSSALSNDPSSSDMCMNAVKKLALTISMVNAFHMYRRIIDDVSGFPLCFPSTSFDSSKDNMRCVQRSGAHSNEDPMDIGRMSWFQDIMRNFFSNSICNDVYDGGRKCMLRSCANDLCPDVTSICSEQSRKSKFASKNKVALRAIDSVCKNPKCKSVCSHCEEIRVFSEPSEMLKTNDSAFVNECDSCSKCTPVRPSCCENSHRESVSESDAVLSSIEAISRPSLSSQAKHCTHHSPDVRNSGNEESSTTEGVHLQKSRKSIASSNSFENIPERMEASSEIKQRHSLQPKKSSRSSLKSSKIFKDSPKTVKGISASRTASYLRIKTLRKFVSVQPKSQNVSLVAKKRGITTSKKIKERKRIQRHRLSVLKKVNFKGKSPKVDKAPKQSLKSPRALLKKKDKQSNLLKAKQIRVSQKLLKQAKSRASTSPSLRLNSKISLSPKLLRKRNEKRKSVVFVSLGLRSKRLDLPAKTKKRKSLVTNISSKKQQTKVARERKGRKSENGKMDDVKDKETESATKSRTTKRNLEMDAVMIDAKKRKVDDDDGEHTPVVKPRKTRRGQKRTAKNTDDKNQRVNRALVKNENKNADSLDRENDNHLEDRHVSVVESFDKYAKILKRISVIPMKETRNSRKRGVKLLQIESFDAVLKRTSPTPLKKARGRIKRGVKPSQAQNTDVILDSQLPQKGVESSPIHDEDIEMKEGKSSDFAPKSSSLKTKTQKGKINVNSRGKNDNQDNQKVDEQSKSRKKFKKGKEKLSVKAETPKKTVRSNRKKNSAMTSSEEDSKQISEGEVKAKVNQKTEGTVLKEITKHATSRALRSKKSKAETTSTDTTEVIEKASPKQNKRAMNKTKKNAIGAAVTDIEEKFQVNENNGNENVTVTTRRKRKNANESKNEIPPKKAVKNLKEEGKKHRVNKDIPVAIDSAVKVTLIKESTNVNDSQNKRRKVKGEEDNVPRGKPRGRSKKEPAENAKKNIIQTEVSSRSLRSRK